MERKAKPSSFSLKPVCATGKVDEQGWLRLSQPLTTVTPGEYQVLLMSAQDMTHEELAARLHAILDLLLQLRSDDAPEEKEWLKAAARNPAFSFLEDPAEDIYTPADGLTRGP